LRSNNYSRTSQLKHLKKKLIENYIQQDYEIRDVLSIGDIGTILLAEDKSID